MRSDIGTIMTVARRSDRGLGSTLVANRYYGVGGVGAPLLIVTVKAGLWGTRLPH